MYNVVLLIERELIALDADQIIALHEGLEELPVFHLLLPITPASAALGASMTALGAGQVVPISEPAELAEVHDHIEKAGIDEISRSAGLLTERGQNVTTQLTDVDPIEALKELVSQVSADEVIILTEPHLVQEFLHLDWTSRARRALDVPTLHLLEHLPFEAQSDL